MAYQMAFLLDNEALWKPITDIAYTYVQAGIKLKQDIKFTTMSTFRILVLANVDTESKFYRWIHDSLAETGSTTAKNESRLLWSGARQLSRPEEARRLFKYRGP
uniref:Uncharacterized protein n=1 Tax=Eutreptiella gymnastica TaxID=73025 RepID=A0A7S1N537_9EUGL|mmetsp:Transcript_121102/g.210619  ORF Transcript_121102/g.210619 Transcript_121102/m.210619 type:complete len:104 (+) Transcript_121102:176-487(+)